MKLLELELYAPLLACLFLGLAAVGVFALELRDLGPKPAPARHAAPGTPPAREQAPPVARPAVKLPAEVEAELDALRAIIDSMEAPA